MPELPEVETVVRGLRRSRIVGHDVSDVRIGWQRTIAAVDPETFRHQLVGTCITNIERRAKFIVLSLSSGFSLLIHLRMTGSLRVSASSVPRDPHERVAVVFTDDRELRFRDTRKFGRWYLTRHPEDILGKLGPEPLSDAFTAASFIKMLRSHRRMLKPLLLDQRFLAGLGNIYVDEALFAARLHPCRIASTIRPAAARRLHESIRAVLELGVARMGTSLGHGAVNFYSVAGRRGRNQDALQVFRRDGEPCPVCGQLIERMIVGQRSTHYCKRCQPAPRLRKRA